MRSEASRAFANAADDERQAAALERAVARASVMGGLFGDDEAPSVGRYRLRGLLGSGAHGQVFVADDPKLRRQVAIKLVETEPGPVCQDNGTCFVPCASNDDCLAESAPECNPNTGLCGCTSDADCETIGVSSASTRQPAGWCGCGSDADCVATNAGDVCNEGACGFSGDPGCEDRAPVYDNTTVVCASP